MSKVKTAAGFIISRTAGAERRYLLLRNRRRGDMGFPKGHLEVGESELDGAFRETEEETGLVGVVYVPAFESVLRYNVVSRRGAYRKQVHYFCAESLDESISLSREHVDVAWLPYDEAHDALIHATLVDVLRQAARFLKDPALIAHAGTSQADAERHLSTLPEWTPGLAAHLRGGARLARTFAEALSTAGKPIHVEATAIATLLHDVGRALGDHTDHQRAGVRHLIQTSFDAYGFACISHFSKGASPQALRGAGLNADLVSDFESLLDLRTLTWEERCAALADSCMKHDEPVTPALRFADLRRRYDAEALIDLQEQRTEIIRGELHDALGCDPLSLVSLAQE